MPRRRKPNPIIATSEIILWVLFFVLLVPAGAVGWAIGHYTGQHTKTVTVGAAAPATTTTAAPTTTAAATTAPATTAAASPAAAGKAVFTANACATCHTFKAAGSTGTIGPNLDTGPAKGAAATHLSVAAFIRQCITDPNKYIPPGYQKGLMPTTFGTTIKPADLTALVAFIAAGST